MRYLRKSGQTERAPVLNHDQPPRTLLLVFLLPLAIVLDLPSNHFSPLHIGKVERSDMAEMLSPIQPFLLSIPVLVSRYTSDANRSLYLYVNINPVLSENM